MAAIDELAPFTAPEDPYRTAGDNDIALSDYARQLAAGAYALPGQLAGAAEYGLRIPSGTDLERIRDWSEEGAKGQVKKMSPGAQRNLQATFLPGEGPTIWDPDVSTGHAIGLRTVGAIPSVLASIIPGMMVARVAGATAGTIAGGTAAASQTAGDTYNNIVGAFRDTPDDQLREESPAYQGFRNMGMSERDARDRLVETVTSYKPALMGAITLATSRYGVEGLLAHRAAGEAGKGVLRQAGIGFAGEATQEAIENASQEALQQQAGFDLRGKQGTFDWAKILEEAVSGGAIGGIIGGGVGAATAVPGRSGTRRRTREEIIGHTQGVEEPVAEVPVAVAPTAVSPAQSTPEVLSTVTAKGTADRETVATTQANPVKAGEEMPAAIAQKPPEQPGGVDLKPGEPTPALTPAPAGVEPAHEVALTTPASVPQTITPTLQQRQLDLIAQTEQELIPPISPHSVLDPEVAAAITHERATSIAQGTINAKLEQARATHNAPSIDPAAALAAAAAPAVTGAVEPAATPVAPAVGVAGTASSTPELAATANVGVAETPVTSIPSEVIPPTVEAPPVPAKRKPGRPRKNTAAPATPGQTAPNDAETQAAKVKATTDDAVARIAEIIRGREAALKSVADFSEGVPIATEAANRIGDIQDAAVPILGRAKAYKLADKAREFLKAERANVVTEVVPGPALQEPALDVDIAPKGRILKDELQARRERKGPRETAHKKAQRERGETEILGKAEDEARLRQRALAEVAASVRKAFDEVTYDRAEMSTAKAQRDYMKALVKAVELPNEPGKSGKKLSLANLPADAPGELRHLVAAKALSQGAGNENDRFSFMANDIALREGTNLATEYAQTQAIKAGPEFTEEVAGAKIRDETGGRNLEEERALSGAYWTQRIKELGREAKRIRREKAETLKYREQLRAEGPVEPETKVVKVEKKARLTPAEIKARAARAAQAAQTRVADAVERAEASPRTEEQAVRQIETIRLGENTEPDEVLRLETRPEGRLLTLPTATGGTVVLSQRPEALRDVMTDMDTRFVAGNMARELAKVLDKYVGDTPVYWVSSQELSRIAGGESDGAYLPRKKAILLNENIRRWPMRAAHTVLHEASHAALFDVLDNNAAAALTVDKLARETATALQARGVKITGTGTTYGLQRDEHGNPNVHEFMSEALTNSKFQQLLASVEASQELKDEVGIDKPGASLWDAFVGSVRRWFGWNRNNITILDLALRHAENALTSDGRELLTRAPSGTEMSLLKTSDFKDGMDDRLAATSLNVSRWGKAVQTVDQIVRGARSLFEGRAPDDLHDALAAMDKQATDGSIASMRLAAKWIEWSRKNKEVAPRAANLAMLAVRNDIDPRKPKDQDKSLTGDKFREYQRVARYDEIKAKWNALPSDARALLDEMFDHYTSIEKGLAGARAKSLVDIWLEGTSTTLTDMQRDALTQRVLKGELTEKDSDKLQPGQQSDEELIGNDDAFRDLQSVELRLPTIYMPHMRHGNIVVRTKEKLPDLMGGTLKEESDKHAVVEFSGPDARDLYEAWAKSDAMVDGPDITSVNLKRYLVPSGELVSEINSRGHNHEVKVEARVMLQGLYAFDKGADANAFIKEAKATNAFASIDQKPLQRADSYDEGDLPPTQLSGILRGIEKRKGIDENTKNLMKATVESAAIRMMPGHRIQQRMLKREGVRGGSEDLSRSLISYGSTASEALARLENMPAVRKALETMRSQIGKVGSKDAQAQSLVVGELTKRVYDNVVHPQDTARWMQDLLRLSQLDKLASPAYTVINGMQPWMVTLPVLGSEHGNMRAAAEMSRAYKDVGFGSVFRDAFGNMKKATKNFTSFGVDINNPIDSVLKKVSTKDDGKRITDGLRKAISLGMIQETAGIETGSGGPPGGKARMVADGVDRIARQLPIAIEAINRGVTFIASYRLAYAQSSNHDMAVQYGIDMINRTQFNYAAWNKPGFFNKPWLRPALQFKAYAQGMTALLGDAVHKTFKGATPKEKKQAFKLLMNVVGVQVAMAGAMGLPGIELIKAGFMIAAMLGLGGGWDDAERWLRQISDDAFGKKPSELIHKGVLSRAVGVDLSTRLGLSDMWLFGEPKMYDRQGTLAYFGQLLMGAPGGLGMDWFEGMKAAGQGDFAKSFELMMPVKFIADTASAARGRFDPNSKSPLSTSDAVLKSIGFRSGAAVERSFETGKRIQTTKDMNAKARELEKDYLQASSAGERVRIKARILTHNKEMNEKKLGLKQKALSPKTLDSIRERRAKERSAITGDE